MEIPTPPQPTTVKTPDPESEPPQSNTVTKQLIPPPLTNGVLKRHKPLHHQPPPPYKECMKNHAAAMGGHAIDGCGEFMPSPASSPTHPTSLKCAACGCHRNFHRREPEESLFPSPTTVQHVIEYQPHHRHHPPPPPPPPPATVSPGNSPSPPPISSSYYPSAPHMLLALSSPPAENNHISPGSGKKRFRTKFTQDQKDKMQELAEQVGWKMHKRHEDTIFAICNQIGVDKNVFKVWMHNNKSNSTTKKQDLIITNGNSNNIPSAAAAAGEGIDFIISRNNQREEHQHQLHLHNDSFNVICPKGSSTSS